MAQTYFCKNCSFNHNGWCDKRKIQGLKAITTCEFNKVENVKLEVSKWDTDAYRVFGKREMLWHFSQQVLGMELKGKESITIEELKSLMVSFGKILEADEQIFNIATEYEVDQLVVQQSKALLTHWEKNSPKSLD